MAVELKIVEILYLFAAFHGVFLASLILFKKPFKNGRFFLFFLILLFSFYLVENVIYSSGYIRQYPHLYFTTLPLIYLIGPLFYLYLRSSVSRSGLKWIDMTHLIPFLFELAILIPFYRLDAEIKIKVYDLSQQQSSTSGTISIYFIGYLVYLFSTFFYFYKSYRTLTLWKPTRIKEKRKKLSLRAVSTGFFLYVFISLALSLMMWINLDIREMSFHINLVSLTLLIHSIGYITFLSPSFLEHSEKVSDYKYSSFEAAQIQVLSDKLVTVMDQEKPHLRSDVSAHDISDLLNITAHELSQLLSVGLNTSFYEYINQHRITYAKQLLLSSNYANAKIIHIAIDCGFSNKSSFLRNFKNVTGLTPTEFKKLHKNQVPIN